jgi:lipoprotein NlpI
MAEFHKAISSNPNSANAHADLGNALLAERKYEEAIEQFHRAVGLDGQNVAAYNGLGRAMYASGEVLPAEQLEQKRIRRRAAIDAFRHAVELAPHDGDAYYNLGIVLRRHDNPVEADEIFQKATDQYRSMVDRDRGNARAHRELGRLLHNSGNHSAAISEYEEAIRIEPKYTEAHRARGLAEFYVGNFGEAASEILIVANNRPEDLYWMLWLYLAEARRSDSASDWASAQNRLKERTEKTGIPKNRWPYPAIQLFLGGTSTRTQS